MSSGTSRPAHRRRFATMALAIAGGLAAALAASESGAWQARPSGEAPGLDGSRPAPGLGGDRPGAVPGLDRRAAPEATSPGVDAINRYRFIESYGPPQAPGDDIGSYRVAFVESLDQAIESAGEAPRRAQLVSRVVYVGRPAIVGGLERRKVTALVRQYESVQVSRDGKADTRVDGPAGLAGQVLWLQDEGGPAPTVLTLPGSPQLTQEQLGFVAYQQIYVPELAGLLSPLHVGVGSQWPVEDRTAEALVGSQIRDGMLTATFEDVLPPAEGETASRAVIRVSGRLELLNSSAAINAQVEFAFEDPGRRRTGAADPGRPISSLEPNMIDAKGAIVRLLLAQREIIEVPGPDGRIASRATQLRELNLERRLKLEGASVPSLPNPPPTPNPENSWVVYRDPENRFLFKHPQDYRPSPIAAFSEETINLQRLQIGGVPDYLTFVFFPRGEVAPEIRPEPFVRRINEVWRSVPPPGVTVARGSEGYLPEREWPGMRVYRLELPLSYVPSMAAIADSGRAYFAAYLVQLANGAVVELEALTESSPESFRDEVEAILRTFTVDPPPARSGAGSGPDSGTGRPATTTPSAPTPPGGAESPEATPSTPADERPAPGAESPPVTPEIDTPPVDPDVPTPPIGPDDAPAPGADRPSRPPPPPYE